MTALSGAGYAREGGGAGDGSGKWMQNIRLDFGFLRGAPFATGLAPVASAPVLLPEVPMKRPLFALALLLAPLSACGPWYYPPPDSGPYGGYEDYDDGGRYDSRSPMRARLFHGAGGLRMHVNRPAHVAVFEVIPGRGVGLLYPSAYGDHSYVRAGYSNVLADRYRPYSWYLVDNPWEYSDRGPRYYLLVASRRPLYVDRYRDEPGALRRDLGVLRYASGNPSRLMEDMVDAVLPAQRDEDWDTDLVTIWPQEQRYAWQDYGDRWVYVRCGNGVRYRVRWEDSYRACPVRGGRDAPPPRDTTRTPPRDTVRIPGRQRPEPRPPVVGETDRARPGPARVEHWLPQGQETTPEAPRVVPRRRDPEPRVEEPREEQPRPQPRRFEPRVEEPRREEPRQVEPQAPAPVRQEPPRVERVETPRVESPRIERSEPPRVERVETPRVETPRIERSEPPRVERVETPRVETPRVERSEPPRVERSEPRVERRPEGDPGR